MLLEMTVHFEIWAQIFLCAEDTDRIRTFFSQTIGVKQKYLLKKLHITVYHARRPFLGLKTGVEPIDIVVPAQETRFMVLAPGGENPRPHLDPGERKVGLRVQWQSQAMPAIQALRQRLIDHESPQVLGKRGPSTARTNAFGARNYQAHMSILRAGSGIGSDLTVIGQQFRSAMGNLRFDQFLIEQVCLTSEREPKASTRASPQGDA